MTQPISGGPVRISLSAVRDLTAVERTWRTLEAASRPSFFQSWTWVGCLAEDRFSDPVLLRAERNGRTVGLALLNRVRGWLGRERFWLNESGDRALDAVYVEHNGVLLARDAEDLLAPCLRAMLTAPAAPAVPPGRRRLRLAGVDAAHLRAMQRVGKVHLLQASEAPFINLAALPVKPSAYLDSLSRNTRYQIRRSDRSFARVGQLIVWKAQSLTDALTFLDGLAVLHQATWTARGAPGAFGNPAFLRFHRALVARALPRGEVELLRIAVGPVVIGYLYNFCLDGRIIAYQSGFDYAVAATIAGPHAKPGLTCHHAAILRATAEHAVTYDFLAGPDRYKKSLARTTTPLYWFDATASRLMRFLNRRLPSRSARERQGERLDDKLLRDGSNP